jgi:hypothetical protein
MRFAEIWLILILMLICCEMEKKKNIVRSLKSTAEVDRGSWHVDYITT